MLNVAFEYTKVTLRMIVIFLKLEFLIRAGNDHVLFVKNDLVDMVFRIVLIGFGSQKLLG